MKKSGAYTIPFQGLKLGKHTFDYQIDKSFFDTYGFDEFESCAIEVKVSMDKKSTFLSFAFKHKGQVTLPCDVTGQLFDLPIKGKMNLLVQFGEAFNDEHEEILIVPHGEHQVDIAQYLYEMMALSIPHKRVSPEGLAQQKQSKSTPSNDVVEPTPESELDPRWAALKKLLTDK